MGDLCGNSEYQSTSKESTLWEYACSDEIDHDQAQFSTCSDKYHTIHYHTFFRGGGLKLTEVELFFLSQHVTLSNVSSWAVVYIGVGDGSRFRYLRDTFFPGLHVIAFDPAPMCTFWTEEVKKA